MTGVPFGMPMHKEPKVRFTKSGVIAGAAVVATLATAVPAAAGIYIERADRGWVYTAGTNNAYAATHDSSCDGQDVAAQYYRNSSPDTLRTLWNGSGCSSSNMSGEGSWIFKMRLEEQYVASTDYYSAWYYDYS
jgi:hypothetical protein